MMGLTVLCAQAAVAQETPAVPDNGALPAVPTTVRDTTSWKRVAPLRVGPASDVAIDSDDPTVVVAVGEDGAGWLSIDAGDTWNRVLERQISGLSNDEDRLQQLDAYLQDVVDIIGADDLEDELDIEDLDENDLEDQVALRQQELQQQITDEIRADLDTQAFLFGDESQSGVLGPRVSLTHGHDELWIGRADGLWLSTDLGSTWRQVLDIASTRVVYAQAAGVFVAGTADGFRYAVDPEAFIDPEDGTEDLLVLDIATAPEGLYAGTDDGLWFTPAAQEWVPTGPTSDVLAAIAPDPNYPEGLWVATPNAVLRSDDRGRRYRAPLGAPIRGVRDLLLLPGRLMAASSDGPWESLDGGTTWVPLSRGLIDPDIRGLAAVSLDSVYAATQDGVFKLVPRAEEDPVRSSDGPVPKWIDPNVLLRAALDRPGVRDASVARNIRGLNSALPQVRIDFRHTDGRDLRWTTAAGTTRGDDGVFQAVVQLTWTPDGRKVASQVSGVILDGELVLVGSDDQTLIAAKVGRRTVSYRRKLTDNVIDLFGARISLMLDEPALAGASLADKVEYRIRVIEVESQLDALTDGYISRYNVANSEGASQ